MLKRKNIVNNSWISQCGIENGVQCILPDILAFCEYVEEHRGFAVWKEKKKKY